jgi:hypothetical protein
MGVAMASVQAENVSLSSELSKASDANSSLHRSLASEKESTAALRKKAEEAQLRADKQRTDLAEAKEHVKKVLDELAMTRGRGASELADSKTEKQALQVSASAKTAGVSVCGGSSSLSEGLSFCSGCGLALGGGKAQASPPLLPARSGCPSPAPLL